MDIQSVISDFIVKTHYLKEAGFFYYLKEAERETNKISKYLNYGVKCLKQTVSGTLTLLKQIKCISNCHV